MRSHAFSVQPASGAVPPSLSEASHYCQRLTARHYENFTVASWWLPRRLRRHFCHLYAYCRWADDLADESTNVVQARALLEWWETELDACYAGQPRHPVFVALRETVIQFAIPDDPLRDLLIAFRRDQQNVEYQTMADLLDYCRYSANPVGQLVLHLAGVHDTPRRRLADQLCTGLQLVNFWQDVRRDAEQGRCYLPRHARTRAGYTDHDLAHHRYTPAFAKLLEGLVDDSVQRLQCGLELASRLPQPFGSQVALYARGGLAIAQQIRRLAYDVWRQRPRLTRWQKAQLIARVAAGSLLPAPRARRATTRPTGESTP